MSDALHGTLEGHDELTGLDRYDAFSLAFEAGIGQSEKLGGECSVGLIDIDRFRKLNETYGCEAGDGVLVALSAHLSEVFAECGAVFRYGGDAFAVVMPGVDKEDAFLTLEQARSGFEGEREVSAGEGKTVTLEARITVGVAAYPADGAGPQDVVRKVNEALYRAKDQGGNKVCLAREEKMVTKTSHYAQGQLYGLSRLAKREGVGEARLLREALDDLLRKYNA
ncbi:MAG: diguanylate cyclase [bacterium]|nr:diguanylate cyclase [bacterium]